MRKTTLTENDYNTFYKAILYGKIEDPLYTAIPVAYRDLCRTIRGFAKHENHDEIFRNCEEVIYSEISSLFKKSPCKQESFDIWHKHACERLIFFSSNILSVGQAQKWINMTLKYLSMFDHKMTEKTYEYYHVPIDNYILKSTKYKEFDTAWSKITSYDKYLGFQKWFRETYDGIPVDVEFNMWLKEGKGY